MALLGGSLSAEKEFLTSQALRRSAVDEVEIRMICFRESWEYPMQSGASCCVSCLAPEALLPDSVGCEQGTNVQYLERESMGFLWCVCPNWIGKTLLVLPHHGKLPSITQATDPTSSLLSR